MANHPCSPLNKLQNPIILIIGFVFRWFASAKMHETRARHGMREHTRSRILYSSLISLCEDDDNSQQYRPYGAQRPRRNSPTTFRRRRPQQQMRRPASAFSPHIGRYDKRPYVGSGNVYAQQYYDPYEGGANPYDYIDGQFYPYGENYGYGLNDPYYDAYDAYGWDTYNQYENYGNMPQYSQSMKQSTPSYPLRQQYQGNGQGGAYQALQGNGNPQNRKKRKRQRNTSNNNNDDRQQSTNGASDKLAELLKQQLLQQLTGSTLPASSNWGTDTSTNTTTLTAPTTTPELRLPSSIPR